MVKVLDKITLDLEKDEVHGWDRFGCAYRAIHYVRGNLQGKNLPAVEVVKKGGVYQLAYGGLENLPRLEHNNEGHLCSIAAYISGGNLDALLLENHMDDTENVDFFPIREMSLFCYNGLDVSLFLGKFPEDVRSRLLERWKVDKSSVA